MQDIYDDLAKKNPDLQQLEKQIEHFKEGREDSLAAFKKYDSKSGSYYPIAIGTLNQIKDTVIRHRLRVLLTNSQNNYRVKTSKFTSLMNKIDQDQLVADDYYLTLKIASTLSVMQEYQDKNMPESKSIVAITSEGEKLKVQTKKLAKKYEDQAGAKK